MKQVYDNITSYLTERGWKKSESKRRFDVLIPPEDLGFEAGYRFYLFNQFDFASYTKEIEKEIQVLSQIYAQNEDELAAILIEEKEILSFHIENSDLGQGQPYLPYFTSLMNRTKKLLENAATFHLVNKAHFFKKEEEAERYLNHCRFFQNQPGSLITKVKLPSRTPIKEGNLFESEVTGHEINQRLFQVTDFINQHLLQKENFTPEDEFLKEHKNVVSVNLVDSIRKIYADAKSERITLSLNGITPDLSSTANDIKESKLKNLASFSMHVRKKIKEIEEHNVIGKVIKLSSRNIESDENNIEIFGKVKDLERNVKIKLNAQQIKQAAEAFKTNRPISLQATLEKTLEGYKALEVFSFKIS